MPGNEDTIKPGSEAGIPKVEMTPPPAPPVDIATARADDLSAFVNKGETHEGVEAAANLSDAPPPMEATSPVDAKLPISDLEAQALAAHQADEAKKAAFSENMVPGSTATNPSAESSSFGNNKDQAKAVSTPPAEPAEPSPANLAPPIDAANLANIRDTFANMDGGQPSGDKAADGTTPFPSAPPAEVNPVKVALEDIREHGLDPMATSRTAADKERPEPVAVDNKDAENPADKEPEAETKTPREVLDGTLASLKKDSEDRQLEYQNLQKTKPAEMVGTQNPTTGEPFKDIQEATQYRNAQLQNLTDMNRDLRGDIKEIQGEIDEITAKEGGGDPIIDDAKKQKEITDLRSKIDDGSITDTEYKKLTDLLKDPAEAAKRRERRLQELDGTVKNGKASNEQLAEWRALKEGKDYETTEKGFETAVSKEAEDKKKLDELDQAWKKTAETGSNPSEAMLAYYKKNAEMGGADPLTDKEIVDFRNWMKEIYKDGVAPSIETTKSRLIKEKFVELGKLEAQIVALQSVIDNMKKAEDQLKTEVNRAEGSYLGEKDDKERMAKLNAWRVKAMQLEGYQIAINNQAARGRDAAIQQRQVAGYIHRKLGTKNGFKNALFGARTALLQASDTFQDVTVDHLRGRFA